MRWRWVMVAVAAVFPCATAFAATSYPNDPHFVNGDQWALTGAPASIDAPRAWCVSTGAGIVIADVDSGADFGHPDLAGKLIAGAQFLGGTGAATGAGQAAVQDDLGHGTMTTGIMVADTNNATGIAAVAPDARALIVKVLNSQGKGYDTDVAAGIRSAADNGASVINLSVGPDVPGLTMTNLTSAIPDAISYAYSKGVAVALAAGNNGIPIAQYTPSGAALVVGALDVNASPTTYSNSADIYAPGGTGSTAQTAILSTSRGGGYAAGSGTSFATPQVAGVLALLMARGMSNSQAYSRIMSTAVSRNGVPDLEAARALGSSGGCGAPVSSTGGAGGGSSGSSGGGGGSGGAVMGGGAGAGPGSGGVPSGSASPNAPGQADSGVRPAAGGGNTGSPGSIPFGRAPGPIPTAPLVAGAVIAAVGVGAGGALLTRYRRRREQ